MFRGGRTLSLQTLFYLEDRDTALDGVSGLSHQQVSATVHRH